MNMKTLKRFTFIGVLGIFLSGCAFTNSPALGTLYTDAHGPHTATSNDVGEKAGTAEASSILGLVATGDASINEAAKNGNITKISHVDYHTKNILGIYATYTVTVYGE